VALGIESMVKHGGAVEVVSEILIDQDSVKLKIRKVYLHTQRNPHPTPY
jgi:hypothetical protein